MSRAVRTPDVPCCACSGTVTFDVSEDGTPSIIHTIPTCERFERVETADEATQYLRDCRRFLPDDEGPRGSCGARELADDQAERKARLN